MHIGLHRLCVPAHYFLGTRDVIIGLGSRRTSGLCSKAPGTFGFGLGSFHECLQQSLEPLTRTAAPRTKFNLGNAGLRMLGYMYKPASFDEQQLNLPGKPSSPKNLGHYDPK